MADNNQKDVLIHIQTNVGKSIEEIIRLDAELNDLNATMRKTKDDLSKVDQEFADGKITQAQYEQETKRLKGELEAMNATLKAINSDQRAHRKELENAAKAYEANEGSIKQLRLQLSNTRKEYESLSKAERESAAGKEMLTKIQSTTMELRTLEEAQGDFRRSVGHYQNALEGISPTMTRVIQTIRGLSGGTMDVNQAFSNAIPLVKNFGKQLLTLIKNPIVLTIVAIVGVIKELVEQFKRTDDAMTALQELFASLSPIMETFREILSMIVGVITKVLGGLSNLVTGVMSLIPGFDEASRAARQLVKDLDDLEEKERQYGVETTKNEIKIAKLRNKVAESDKYTTKERRKALGEAIELEKKNADMEAEVAKEKYRLAVADAARRKDTSDETKNTIAELEKQWLKAIANGEEATRRMRKQLSTFNAEIRKDAQNTWKSIMGSDAFSSAERKKADADFKKQVDNLQKKADDFKKIAEDLRTSGDDVLAAEWEAYAKQAQSDADETKNIWITSHKSMLDSMKSDWVAFRNNEKAAQRGYEDAILAGMDDTLDKQLQLVENEYKREIEDLRFKLKTEEKLTEEARDYINKTIEEKQRQLDEKLILTQAKYWSEVRETARQTINDIIAMNDKLAAADPNRIVGGFAGTVRDSVRKAGEEMRTESEKLNKAYQGEFHAMTQVIKTILADTTNDASDTVKKAFDSILKKTDEFAGKATDDIVTFMDALSAMRKRIGMSDKDYNAMVQMLRPYLKNITEYYNQLISLPEKYQTYITNTVMNQMKDDAERIRKNTMEILGQLMPNEYPDYIKQQITDVDDILYKSVRRVNERLVQLASIEKRSFQEVYNEWITNELDWNIVTGDTKADNAFHDMGVKYGKTFVSSFSNVLKNISGKTTVDEQLNWLVNNYETAVQSIEQINKDFAKAYAATNNEAFKKAMIDESVFLPQLRKIYEEAKKYTDVNIDWEGERLEIQGRYIGEADRELKVEADLLALERERLDIESYRQWEQQRFLEDIREDVVTLQQQYEAVSTKNNAEITLRQQQLEQLRAEAALFDETTSAEAINKNNEMVNKLEEEIENLRKSTEEALRKLADTGFLSVDELDAALQQVGHSIMTTNNAIQANTEATAQNVTNLWFTAFSRVTGGMSTVLSAFNGMYSEMGELNERWNAFAEASAYMLIGVNLAEGIAEAVAAGAGVPFPANIPAIAAGVAAVATAIGSAFSTYNQYHNQPKFADGGLIGGEYARTRAEGRKDDIDIKASRGEYIINAEKVKKYGVGFFDRINYGRTMTAIPKLRFADGGYVTTSTLQSANDAYKLDEMRTILIDAVSEIHPEVSVMEISRAQNKVSVAERNARR